MISTQLVERSAVTRVGRVNRRPSLAASPGSDRRYKLLPRGPVALEVPRPRFLDDAGGVDLALALHQ